MAGLIVAVAGGLLANALLGAMRFGGILLPALVGFGVGRAVAWGAQRQTQQPFAGIAVGLSLLGGLLAVGVAGMSNIFGLLGVAAAGYFSLRGLRG